MMKAVVVFTLLSIGSSGVAPTSSLAGSGSELKALHRRAAPVASVTNSDAMAFMTRSVTSGLPLLYISAQTLGTVEIYLQNGRQQKPIGRITGLDAPSGLAVDRHHNLWVNSLGSNTILGFHRGATTPFTTLRAPSGFGIAVDATDNVYAPDLNSNAIYVYAKGATKPTKVLVSHKMTLMYYVAVDANGDVFCSGGWDVDSSNTVYPIEEFLAGSTRAIVLQEDMEGTGGLSFAEKHSLVFDTNSTISVFSPPYNGTAFSTFSVKGAAEPVAVSPPGKSLWLAVAHKTRVAAEQYSLPDGGMLTSTASARLNPVRGIAVDPPIVP
jgi:DNA-binding beta-propeller fold protein YncE